MINSDGDNPMVSAPTQSLLQRWLREEHNIHVIPMISSNVVYYGYEIIKYSSENENGKHIDADFKQPFSKTYEEALEVGLQEALKLIKN